MNAAQWTALRAWLISVLQRPLDYGGAAYPFPADHVYRSAQDEPRGVYPICAYWPISRTSTGSAAGDYREETARQVWQIQITANPGSNVEIEVAPSNPPTGVSGGSTSTAPGVDVTATRDAVLADLQALEGAGHVAEYVASGTDSITVTATEAARGLHLGVSATPAEVVAVVTSENCLRHSRDLSEVTVRLRLWSQLDEAAPTMEDDANTIAARLAGWVQAQGTEDGLREAGLAVLRVGTPQDISALAGGSQYVTGAAVDLVIGLSPEYTIGLPTIEAFEVSGTLSPDGPAITSEV